MANYVIGDIQGCFDEYSLLLNKIKFDSKKDFIWLTGDLINRGPASLSVLKHVYDNRKAIKTVLGNHDLHFPVISNFNCGFFKFYSSGAVYERRYVFGNSTAIQLPLQFIRDLRHLAIEFHKFHQLHYHFLIE